MLTLKVITENPDEVIRRLAKKHFDAKEIIGKIIELDKTRRTTQSVLDENLATLNNLSKTIGALMKEGKTEEAEQARAKVAEMKEGNKELDAAKTAAEQEMNNLLVLVPNLPHDSVPEGRAAEDNLCEKSGGVVPQLHEGAVPHWDLCKKYDLIDFELGVKITGAGFPVYKGYGCRLQRALINFFLDNAREAGYLEIQPPYVVNADSGYGTGQLPDKEGQMYHATLDDLYLIPTAEVPVTNIYRDVILNESELPIKNTAYSACFRREAGSYGKDVRGLNRLHQFDKVEIVRIDTPEHSYESLKEMVDYVQSLVEKLELPWRILRLCGGDMSFTSAITFAVGAALPLAMVILSPTQWLVWSVSGASLLLLALLGAIGARVGGANVMMVASGRANSWRCNVPMTSSSGGRSLQSLSMMEINPPLEALVPLRMLNPET